MTAKTSDYITVKETAEAWGVSRRYVNMCIEDGRVPDAVKMGNMWLVPKGVGKPVGSRREKKQSPETPLSSDLAHIIEATVAPWPSDNPDAILDTVSEKRLRLQYEGEFAYLRGDFARVIECYRELGDDDAAKLRACPLTIAAAISAGDYPLYKEIETYLKGVVQANSCGDVTAIAELALNTAYVSAIAPGMVSDWLKNGDFSALPILAKPDAAYKRAKYFQSIGNFEAMLAVAQTALSLCDPARGITYAGIYFRAACAAACCGLKRAGEAERYLRDALNIALPHGFITPFAESATAFGGLLEQLLEREYPAHLAAVTAQWKRTFENWIAFHNEFTKDNITFILSLRDYQMAQLAARGASNAEIAKRFHVSVGRLKIIMNGIYGRLSISNRKELARFIL